MDCYPPPPPFRFCTYRVMMTAFGQEVVKRPKKEVRTAESTDHMDIRNDWYREVKTIISLTGECGAATQ